MVSNGKSFWDTCLLHLLLFQGSRDVRSLQFMKMFELVWCVYRYFLTKMNFPKTEIAGYENQIVC